MSQVTSRSPIPPSSSPTPPSPAPLDIDMMEPLNQREQIRLEFYRTYDVMTGVRIAATLGGFFGMMVLLVLYKSRCRYGKSAISDVQLAAAAAVVEEEEQQEAVAAALYMQSLASARCPRRSLGNMSAPLPLAAVPLQPSSLSLLGQAGTGRSNPPGAAAASCNPSTVRLGLRFSSLGGHALLNPPTLVSAAGKRASRRASYMGTRHDGATATAPRTRYPPPQRAHSADAQVPTIISTLGVIESSSSCASPVDSASMSMSVSGPACSLPVEATAIAAAVSSPVDPEDYPGFPGDFGERPPRRAPLARISTYGGSKDPGEDKSHSAGSDSVFMIGADDLDTEDEVDEFSTDSETFRPTAAAAPRLRHFPRRPLLLTHGATPSSLGAPLEVPLEVQGRHQSAPEEATPTTETSPSQVASHEGAISSSQSCRTLKAPSPTTATPSGSTSVAVPFPSTPVEAPLDTSGLAVSDTSSNESLLLDPDSMKSAAVLKISIHEPVTVKSRELLQARPSKVFASLDSAASDERSLTPDQTPTVLSKQPAASDEEFGSESASGRRFSEHLSLKVVRKQRKLSCDEGRSPKGGTRFVTSSSCDVLNKHLVVTLEPDELATQPSWSQETLF